MYTEASPLVPKTVISTAEYSTSGTEGTVYLGTNIGNVANRSLGLIRTLFSSLPTALTTLNGMGFIALGSVYIGTGVTWVRRDASNEFKRAEAISKQAQLALIPDSKKAFVHGRWWIASAGLANCAAYVAAGVAFVAIGTLILAGKGFAEVLKVAVILTGAIYVGRGLFMLVRAVPNYHYTHGLHSELKSSNIDSSQELIKLFDKYAVLGETDKYTGKTREELEDLEGEALTNYLKDLDKSLYVAEYQAGLGICIATAMLIGGAVSVAAAATTGGASTALTFTSFAIFAASETAFIPYDHDSCRDWLVNNSRLKSKALWYTGSAHIRPAYFGPYNIGRCYNPGKISTGIAVGVRPETTAKTPKLMFFTLS